MKISVINGSPKAKHSITLQHIHYFIKENPGHDIEIINVASRIAKIEKDEHKTSEEITKHIQAFAKELELASDQNLEFGARFYQVAGGKIFRDFIYSTHAVFRADHIFYKKIGFYKNFPQRRIKKRLSNAIFSLFVSIKPIRKIIHREFIPQMVSPYKKMLNRI